MGCFIPNTQIHQTKCNRTISEKRKQIPIYKNISVLFNQRIGIGATSEVFLVQLLNDNQYYALKKINKTQFKNPQDFEYCISYIRQENMIYYPKFIMNSSLSVMKLTQEIKKQTFYQSMLQEGIINIGELYHQLALETSFHEDKAMFYAGEVVVALEELHKNNIIYRQILNRDLKPENILIAKTGHIKLADFGFAKALSSSQYTTKTFCGTPTYIAPELYLGNEYSKNVDWYSLGVLIYQMISGKLQFNDKNINILMRKIIHVEFKRMNQ